MSSEAFIAETVNQSSRKILQQLTQGLGSRRAAALLDPQGNLLQGFCTDGIDIGYFEPVVKNMGLLGPIKMGETYLCNDPYLGNTRLCDLVFTRGVFQKNQLRYLISVKVSRPQLTKLGFGDELFTNLDAEGLRIPPTPIEVDGGKFNPDLLGYLGQAEGGPAELEELFSNVRNQILWAEKQIIQLENQTGARSMGKIWQYLWKYSENKLKKAMELIPDGEYSTTETLDHDGFQDSGVKIKCTLSIEGHHTFLNFTGTSKQVKGPYNCTETLTAAACLWALHTLSRETLPLNGGLFKAFALEAPRGSIVNANSPAPVFAGAFETTKRIVDSVQGCLSQAIPNLIGSPSGGSTGLALFKSTDGKVALHTIACGSGAKPYQDGQAGFYTDVHNSPEISLEKWEKDFPLRVLDFGFRSESGGHGLHKGGNGLTRTIEFLEETKVMLLGDRRVNKPKGLNSGTSGTPADVSILRQGQLEKGFKGKSVLTLNKGDRITFSSAGGGGWGAEVTKDPDDE